VGRKRVAVSISMPTEMAEEYERFALAEAKNRSQLFRDMFLSYKQHSMEREFEDLQRYGAGRARERRILTEDDVARIVFEGR
jgi:metal-responsive CopG/Arc/MetJ family transcriptional regulator